MKDFNYDCEEAMKLIDEAIAANIIKFVIFNGKVACRIIRADSNADDTIIVLETQGDHSQVLIFLVNRLKILQIFYGI